MVRLDIFWAEPIEFVDGMDMGYKEIRGVKKWLEAFWHVIRKMEVPFREVEKAVGDGTVDGKSVC